MNFEKENQLLKMEIERLNKELEETKEHLKKYTSPERNKKYYNEHKKEIIAKQKPTSSEKRKEYNRISYLRRKDKENELILNVNNNLNNSL
jgi:hypothetical protein